MAGLVVTTWNVENFSSQVANYAAKRKYLNDALAAIDPDVVALQEVLDPQAASDLATDLGYIATIGTPDGRGNRVAFLTRKAPASGKTQHITAWRLKPGVLVQELDSTGAVSPVVQLGRPALKITVKDGNAEVDLINAHLKSKLLTFPGGAFSTRDESLRASVAYFALQRRSAEATTLREHITDLLTAKRRVIALGDFNDGPQAATTEILYGPPGSQPRGPEDATNANGAFQREDTSDAARVFNVAMLLPASQRWSRKHEGQPELLDQVLVSAGLMPRTGALRQVPSVEIENAEAPNRAGDDSVVEDGVVPDHAPVTIRLA
jgi:endonuclease/exonuclease/phosphatase family metal-dependent hydrolase